jgi:hypothetical protein
MWTLLFICAAVYLGYFVLTRQKPISIEEMDAIVLARLEQERIDSERQSFAANLVDYMVERMEEPQREESTPYVKGGWNNKPSKQHGFEIWRLIGGTNSKVGERLSATQAIQQAQTMMRGSKGQVWTVRDKETGATIWNGNT